VALVRDNNLSAVNNRECVIRYRSQIEEAVVEHAALKLLGRLNFSFQKISDYEQFVKDYDQKVLVALYGGDYRELLDYQQQTRQHASFTSPAGNFSQFTKDYQQLIAEKAIDPARQILEVSLSYDESKNPQVSISETRILNGYIPYQFPNLSSDTYTLKILNKDGLSLETLRFNIPNIQHTDSLPNQQADIQAYTFTKKAEFIQNIKYYSAATHIEVVGSSGNVIVRSSLDGSKKIDNKPSFKLINGADIVNGLKTGKLNNYAGATTGTATQEQKRKVNIAFIGDGSQNYQEIFKKPLLIFLIWSLSIQGQVNSI